MHCAKELSLFCYNIIELINQRLEVTQIIANQNSQMASLLAIESYIFTYNQSWKPSEAMNWSVCNPSNSSDALGVCF